VRDYSPYRTKPLWSVSACQMLMASVVAALALSAATAGAFSVNKRVSSSGIGDDWAWADMATPPEVEEITPSSPNKSSVSLADRGMQPPANASANASSHSQVVKESTSEKKANTTKPEPQAVPTSSESVSTDSFGKELPTAQQIQADNKENGCVTIDSPLAKPSFARQIAKVGTPCVFRADNRDEALHCMGVETGIYGQYGWCWTNLQRTEWGSCSEACPLVGERQVIGEKLARLEELVETLSEVASEQADGAKVANNHTNEAKATKSKKS